MSILYAGAFEAPIGVCKYFSDTIIFFLTLFGFFGNGSQLQDLFFQNRECIENFLWLFFSFFKSRKEKKSKSLKKNESVLRKKLAKRYFRELKSEMFMFKIKSET